MPSGDIWSLGTVLVEALTNRLPARDRTDEQDPKLPEDIPQPFGDIAAHCLNSDPGRRWSSTEIRECLDRARTAAKKDVTKQEMSSVTEGQKAHAPTVAITASLPRDSETIVESHGRTGKQRGFRLAVAIIVALVLIAAGVRMFHHSTETRKPVSTTSIRQSTESSLQPLTTDVSKSTTDNVDYGAVSHQVLPDVPSKARNTITGKVKVTVKVAVDASGAVSHASLVSRGPSEYFANQALQAARKWTFKPPRVHGSATPSEWSLSFEFKSNGTTAAAQRTSPCLGSAGNEEATFAVSVKFRPFGAGIFKALGVYRPMTLVLCSATSAGVIGLSDQFKTGPFVVRPVARFSTRKFGARIA